MNTLQETHRSKCIWALLVFALILSSCSKSNPLSAPDLPNNNNDTPLKQLSVKSAVSSLAETSYPHFCLVWKKHTTNGSLSPGAYAKADKLENLFSFNLSTGNYLLAMLAISNTDGVNIQPAFPLEGASSVQFPNPDQIIISPKANQPIPDILIGSKSIPLLNNSSETINVQRCVCRLDVTISGIPTSYNVTQVKISIGGLYDQVSMGGTFSLSNEATEGAYCDKIMSYDDANTNYSASLLSFPTVKGKNSFPLTLTISLADGTNKTISSTATGQLDANNEILLATTYEEITKSLSVSPDYPVWTVNSTPITTIFKEEESSEGGDVGGDAAIGSIVSGGVVFASGKVISLVERSGGTATWGTVDFIGLTSADGAQNYTQFEAWCNSFGNGASTKWNSHYPFKYVRDLREDGSNWYIPSKEEWTEIAQNITVINSTIEQYKREGNNTATIIMSSSYWTSSEDPASNGANVYKCNSMTGEILSQSKGSEARVRAIKKL